MRRKRDDLISTTEIFSGLDGPVSALRESPPQARRHFTRFDQVDQLVGASEADADLGFMARLLALCSLPRTNPGDRLSNRFSVIFFRACREELLHLFFPAGQVQVLPAG